MPLNRPMKFKAVRSARSSARVSPFAINNKVLATTASPSALLISYSVIPQISRTAQTTGIPAITPGLRLINSATAFWPSGIVATEVTSVAPSKSSAIAIRIKFSRVTESSFAISSASFKDLLNVIALPLQTLSATSRLCHSSGLFA